MRVISVNVNGIRSAAKKGFFDWMLTTAADVICLQEVRASIIQLGDAIFHPQGYHSVFVEARQPGYSGVAIYYKQKPARISTRFGCALSDDEGRFVQLDYPQFSVASVYFPSGTTGDHRQAQKYVFLAAFKEYLHRCTTEPRQYIFCGDWNIAHTQKDIKNWRANQKNSGFLPEERAWLDEVLNEMGYVDAFRLLDDRAEQYTWWSNRGRAYANNVGWRIDYQIVSQGLRAAVRAATIYREQRFSDHAPVILDYEDSFLGKD